MFGELPGPLASFLRGQGRPSGLVCLILLHRYEHFWYPALLHLLLQAFFMLLGLARLEHVVVMNVVNCETTHIR